MAWRPSDFLLDGELDNTAPGTVTGWMRFAGLPDKVTFNLAADFHRDIRGAKIRLHGTDPPDHAKASTFMDGFGSVQSGNVGDITAGLPPRDYVDYPYIEWYSEANGRVVLELDARQIAVVGQPIPACESDPVSRQQQARNMADFLIGLGTELRTPAIAVGDDPPLVSDPAFSHWVVEQDTVIGEAHSVESERDGICFAYVRLFAMPECAEYGTIASANLRVKEGGGQ